LEAEIESNQNDRETPTPIIAHSLVTICKSVFDILDNVFFSTIITHLQPLFLFLSVMAFSAMVFFSKEDFGCSVSLASPQRDQTMFLK